MQGQRCLGRGDGPEHVAVIGQGMHPGHGDLPHCQQILGVLGPQGGCTALQSEERGRWAHPMVGDLQGIPSLVLRSSTEGKAQGVAGIKGGSSDPPLKKKSTSFLVQTQPLGTQRERKGRGEKEPIC